MKRVALIVDDVEMNREILIDMLDDTYDCREAANGEEAIEILKNSSDIAIMLLDLVMPGMGGLEVLQAMRLNGQIDSIPVLVISSETSMDTQQKCFSYGVFDYIQKPFDRLLVLQRVKNAVDSYAYKNNLENQVREQTKELRIQNEKLEGINESVIELLGSVVEARNLESGLHIKRVKEYTRILAQTMRDHYPECGLDDHQINLIVSASPLHDIGKILITDDVLLKPGKLNDEEYAYIKTHTTKGCELLKYANHIWSAEYNEVCYEIARHHHERYDGKGYPDNLVGEEIPLSAQLVSVADVYDALVTDRPYKKPFAPDVAFQMIMNGECGAFSPRLLDCFRIARNRMEQFTAQTIVFCSYNH